MTRPGTPGRALHTQDRLATGSPTYGGGSNAATFGTVDPSGYVERSRRSGLAKSILGRGDASGRGAAGAPRAPGAAGVGPSMLGETASRLDRGELIRRLAARMSAAGGQ